VRLENLYLHFSLFKTVHLLCDIRSNRIYFFIYNNFISKIQTYKPTKDMKAGEN